MSENSIKFPNLAEFFGLDYIILFCGVCGYVKVLEGIPCNL